jgi:hypothetical protein
MGICMAAGLYGMPIPDCYAVCGLAGVLSSGHLSCAEAHSRRKEGFIHNKRFVFKGTNKYRVDVRHRKPHERGISYFSDRLGCVPHSRRSAQFFKKVFIFNVLDSLPEGLDMMILQKPSANINASVIERHCQ